MRELVNLKIATKESEATRLFESLIPGHTFMTIEYSSPREYVENYLYALNRIGRSKPNSTLFEYIIYTLLYRERIKPFYPHTSISEVPLIKYDTLLFSQECPICLSLKTSLRERYKQADLEAIALKYVHRKAKSFLLTLDEKEAKTTKSKIPEGLLIGLDDVIDCHTEQLDELLDILKSIKFCESKKIDVIVGNLVK